MILTQDKRQGIKACACSPAGQGVRIGGGFDGQLASLGEAVHGKMSGKPRGGRPRDLRRISGVAARVKGAIRRQIDRLPRGDIPRWAQFVVVCAEGAAVVLPKLDREAIGEFVKCAVSTRDPVAAIMKLGYFAHRDFWGRELTSPVGKYVGLRGSDGAFLNAGSYDYMGNGGGCRAAVIDAIRKHGHGQASPSLVRQLEAAMAGFVGKDDAIVCPTGYSTNANLVPHLVDVGAVCLADEQIHTSTRIGLQHRQTGFRHNDLEDLERLLISHRGRDVWVFVEGIYSMEGDLCPLPDLLRLRREYGFSLYVDEAHSIAAIGATGRGVCEYWSVSADEVDVLMGTFSKSFASQGGYLAASEATVARIREGLALEPDPERPITVPCAAQVLAVLREGFCTDRLREVTHSIRDRLQDAGLTVLGDRDSPIVPVLTWRPTVWAATMDRLTRAGVAAVTVGPPAVSWNQLRLRLCANATFTDEDIEALVAAFSGRSASARIVARAPMDVVEDDAVLSAIRNHGVGNCGPFQFYGTNVIHRQLERTLAARSGYSTAILYPSAHNMLHSVIGLLARSGDAVLLPRGSRGMLRRAARESRGAVYSYDLHDLHALARKLRDRHRKLIVTVSPCDGPSVVNTLRGEDLSRVELLLDTVSAAGQELDCGRLVALLRQVSGAVHHALLSFEGGGDVTGGAYLTSLDIDDHRIRSKSFVFSASLPIFCVEAVRRQIEGAA